MIFTPGRDYSWKKKSEKKTIATIVVSIPRAKILATKSTLIRAALDFRGASKKIGE